MLAMLLLISACSTVSTTTEKPKVIQPVKVVKTPVVKKPEVKTPIVKAPNAKPPLESNEVIGLITSKESSEDTEETIRKLIEIFDQKPWIPSKPKIPVSELFINQAQQHQINKEWGKAYTIWNQLAHASEQPEKSRYYNLAALMLYRNGQIPQLPEYYQSLPENSITGFSVTNQKILLAASYFIDGKTYQSLTTLPDLSLISNKTFLSIAYEVKADGVLNIGKPLESTKILLKRQSLISNEEDLIINFEKTWDAINRISEKNIIKALSKPDTPNFRGWLELSLISRRSNFLPAKMEPWIQQWHLIYSDHSASEFATKLLAQSKDVYINPSKIALMLPLDGKLAKVSKAIQDGFLYAYYQSEEIKPEIEIINTNTDESFNTLYKKAVATGADFIVGPINKKTIANIGIQLRLDVPLLALNYSSEPFATANFFQFGLKPEDEAEQIADIVLVDQKFNAATLTPDTSWGNRLDKAFKTRFERLGGTLHAQAKYPSRKSDYGQAIKEMLNLNRSVSRHKLIQGTLGEKTEFKPRRRQDIDVIFIAANARQARLIKPQLKFHYAQDIQVYATSHITSSKKSADKDRDLNGVLYIDMPWSLKSNQLNEFNEINEQWPALNKTHGRLFALGIDAYRIIPKLKRLQINDKESFQGLTGKLSVDKFGRVHRALLLATYTKGKSHTIGDEIE